jgi:hypothetical protein
VSKRNSCYEHKLQGYFYFYLYSNADNKKVLHNNNNNKRRKLPNLKLTASKACFLLAKNEKIIITV